MSTPRRKPSASPAAAAAASAKVVPTATATATAAAAAPARETVNGALLDCAFSDIVLASCNYYSASVCYDALLASRTNKAKGGGEPLSAMCGFLLVAFAASAGVVRYTLNVNCTTLAALNRSLAETAACVGLPLVGLHYLRQVEGLQDFYVLPTTLVWVVACTVNQAISNAFPAGAARDLHRVITNAVLFIVPALLCGIAWNGALAVLASVAVFALAGVLIRPIVDERLFGIRREVLFNTSLGVASLLLSSRLSA